ncbi:molybdate ABC transporter permease subunit [Desulfitibacter alkalitolerans]|uniref:molybdate ABC transporter permease subunit n=1 Tax=Desulfitibacter alkalitolerans TaxID=264641 RepID=UPI000483F14B|nr:molybdate ABC transporter permease subunit [Desulfitibacter alkalitolerans]
MTMDLMPLWISIKTAGVATIIAIVAGLAFARFVAFSAWKGKEILDGVLILPLVLPPTVIGFILLVLLGRTGPIGRLLAAVDITIVFSWPAAVIAASVVAFPLMYRTARGAFEQVDPNVLDAARTMGSSEWEVFWRVLLPLSWPSLLAGIILSFARALGEFGATLMLAGNIPNKTQTIPIAIYFAVEGGNRTAAAVWTLIIIILSLMTILALNYYTNNQKSQRIIRGSR